MSLLAIISGLAALLAFIGLWLLSLASQREVVQRFPDYGARIYRSHRTAFQQGPVRTYRLLLDEPPREATAAVRQMRRLAMVAWGSAMVALASWALS